MPTEGVSPWESVRRRSSSRSSLRACARSCQCLASTWRSSGHIAKAAEARSLVVGFRLAPEHPYPAQVDDAETAYRWLLSRGYEPQNIGSTGQSIGGTLAVMLPLRLLANGEPTPGAIVSISPWADLTIQNPAVDENEKTDKKELTRAVPGILAARPGPGVHRPPDQPHQRRSDRPATHQRLLRRV
jgi:acetyl esterase/lipase